MNDKNDASWVLDSLVGFLKSPVWVLSAENFIEQKSVIFEPETEEQSDQNDALEQEYLQIFNEYKEMVDTLIGSHMEDLQITPEQFENACLHANENLGSKLHSILFEQLWAAFNYRIFRRMMIQRNIDLQLQALELLGQKLNVSAETMSASSLAPESQICEEEFEMMRELFRRSSIATNQQSGEKLVSNETITKTVDETVPKLKDEVKMNGHEDEVKKPDPSHTQVKLRRASSARVGQSALIEKVLHTNDAETSNQAEQLDNEQKMILLLGNATDGQQTNKEELEKRQKYLRTQRDKIIELNRVSRTRSIIKVSDEQQQINRPKSARALRSSLKKDILNEEAEEKDEIKKTNENKENSSYRRMLAAKLKADLIGGSIGDVIVHQSSSTSER